MVLWLCGSVLFCIFYGFYMVFEIAIWLLIKFLNMVAGLVMVVKFLSLLVYQFFFNIKCLVTKVLITYGNAI